MNGKFNCQCKLIFISSEDSDEIHAMHTKSDKIEIMAGSETDELIEESLSFLAKISKWFRTFNERK